MSHAVTVDEPGAAAPAVLSVLVHAGFVIVLVFGLNWQTSRPDAVSVELWSQLPPLEPVKVEPKPEPEVKPPPKPEPKIEAAPKKPDIVVEREKKVPKKRPVKKEPPPLKLDDTRRIQEQLAQEQRAFDQREREQVLKEFAAPSAPTLDAGYADKIRSKIKSNIILPRDIKGNPEAIFEVIQLPTGEVLSVKLKQSSGLNAYDDAVERAILKSSPLPRPDSPGQFRRDLQLKFRPQE